MSVVYKISDNIISSLGFSSAENFGSILQGVTGIDFHPENYPLPEIYPYSQVNTERLEREFEDLKVQGDYTRFEKLVILSVSKALEGTGIETDSRDVLFILSTTKGNIDLLDPSVCPGIERERLYLWRSAQLVSQVFKNPVKPLVVSNACTSGVSAIMTANLLLRAGRYSTIVVSGADIVSRFTLSGFYSFKALSPQVCRPFDSLRDGLNLGEGAGTIILSTRKPGNITGISFKSGTTSNDANHISGPSRTGEGLLQAITEAMKGIDYEDLAFINAHGTATPYNDEMEAIAFSRAGINNIPVNSFKGYLGHTLGAAGIIESILSSVSLEKGMICKSLGYSSSGVSVPLNVAGSLHKTGKTLCLKTASGFGGTNAAIIIQKEV